MKILLIDKSTMLRLVHEKALIKAGYEVTSASNVDQGLRVAHADKPDLILVDIPQPTIPGPDVLGRLKCDPCTKQIPVVAFGGRFPATAARLMDQGAVDH